MHNYTAIFLAVDCSWCKHLQWEFGIFPMYFGIVYVLFSYAYARLPQGYYIYSFLDPANQHGSGVLVGAFVRLQPLLLRLVGHEPAHPVECALGGLALAFWVSRIVLFRRQVNDNPYAFQFSTEG